jgi:cyanophycin synthetase
MDVTGRRIGVIAAPGDRRDEDIREIARIAAGHFDHYICKADDRRRGRDYDEVPQMQRETLITEGVPENHIEIIPDETEAVSKALRTAEPGDLLVIFGDDITRTWKQIIHFRPDAKDAAVAETATSSIMIDGEEEPFFESFVLDDQRLIRDERGVRLAKEEAD